MGTLSELLRWKKSVQLTEQVTVWIRIIGDWDLQEAYRYARVASAKKRAALRDVNSVDYRDEVLSFAEASKEECLGLIKAARGNLWVQEALSNVVRPDAAKVEEIAVDPDAPTLEEQEKLDAANLKIDFEYQQAIQEYSAQRELELNGELEKLELEALRSLAQVEVSMIVPLTVFMNELQDQKLWRSVYDDEACKHRSFESVEDFRAMVRVLKDKLILAYSELESGTENLKN